MINDLIEIAGGAGAEVLRFYDSVSDVEFKADRSPLTAADKASHEYICGRLSALKPGIPVVSEESPPEDLAGFSSATSEFWLVDPLDGTKEFLKKTGDFTVNIALISNRKPVLGVVYIPAHETFYFAEEGSGSFRMVQGGQPEAIRVRPARNNALCVVASKDHAGREVISFLERIPGVQLTSRGSSLKFCLVAEGKADLYPRFVPTMEWDTAAADCVLRAAGGSVLTLDRKPLLYQKDGLKNTSIIAVGDGAIEWQRWLS